MSVDMVRPGARRHSEGTIPLEFVSAIPVSGAGTTLRRGPGDPLWVGVERAR